MYENIGKYQGEQKLGKLAVLRDPSMFALKGLYTKSFSMENLH